MTALRRPPEIAITGIGLLTPAGQGIEQNWERILAGRSAASLDPALLGQPIDFTCRVPDFDPDRELGRQLAWRSDRFVQLAVVAARDAVDDAKLDPATWNSGRVGVVLGNSLGGAATLERQHLTLLTEGAGEVSPLTVPMTMVNMVAGAVSIDCRATGPSMVIGTACASGANAIGAAMELLRTNRCDVVLAGSVESALTPACMNALHRMGALSKRRDDPAAASRPFDVNRDGFVAAEGAGVLVLERAEDAAARGAFRYAHLAGFGAASDAHHITAPDPLGRGMERALRAALADAGTEPGEVDYVNAHGTSTPLNDSAEAAVLTRVLGEHGCVSSTKGVTGHTLAAAGAIEAAYAALSVAYSHVPPTANLTELDPRITLDVVAGAARSQQVGVAVSTSLGFGGHNAALVLRSAA
jgi:3-oxoacyl-[acyl-carrier-protein] synthase II